MEEDFPPEKKLAKEVAVDVGAIDEVVVVDEDAVLAVVVVVEAAGPCLAHHDALISVF